MVVLVGIGSATVAAADGALEQLVEQADAIVLAEIRSTDPSAMPADGPMKVQANVVKGVKGPLAEGARVRFDASAWMGPTYQPGGRRIVFLKRSDAQGMAEWASTEVGRLDLFFTDEAPATCTTESLAAFLRALGRQPPRARVQFDTGRERVEGRLLVPDVDRSCHVDGDCAHLSTHCGGCSCGSAINRAWLPHYEEAGRVLCEGYDGPVCDIHCPQQVPHCVASHCELGL